MSEEQNVDGSRKYPVCPDCGAVGASGKIVHVETCPIGMGIDEVTATNREWFASNTSANERRREVSWAEGADLKIMGYMPDVPGEWAGEVVVKQLSPGVRTRRFDEVFFVPTVPEDATERAEWLANFPKNPRMGLADGEMAVFGPEPRFSGPGVPASVELGEFTPTFRDLPRDLEQIVDQAIADRTWRATEWEGVKILVVSEFYLAATAELEGKSWEEAKKGAWVLERGDGHRAYVWRAQRLGVYGMGKPLI